MSIVVESLHRIVKGMHSKSSTAIRKKQRLERRKMGYEGEEIIKFLR
jgi:hypothetical protein